MRNKIILLLLICFIGTAYSAESKVLKWLGQKYKDLGLPTFTEYAWMIGLVNVYEQTAGFVRSTNQLAKSYQKAYQEQKELKERIERLWGKVNRMYAMIDPYNLDTWAQTLQSAQVVLRWDCADILYSMNLLDYYTIGACTTYVNNLDKAFSYDYRYNRNKKTVSEFYAGDDYFRVEMEYVLAFDNYLKNTMEQLRIQLAIEEGIVASVDASAVQKAEARKKIQEIKAKIDRLEQTAFQTHNKRVKIDSIIHFTNDMIAMNLTEMQVIEGSIKEFEQAANYLKEVYNNLKSGEEIGSKNSGSKSNENEKLDFSNEKIFGIDPDKVLPPKSPSLNKYVSQLKNRDISNHDILNLQNMISYTTLKQEIMLRDLEVIKTRTMAMNNILEAYKRERHEYNAFLYAHQAKVISMSGVKQ